jgi:D-mannonate dehydratase
MDNMRVALGQFNEVTDENLLFAKQLGVEDIQLNTPKLPGDRQWEFMDLLQLRMRIEDAGLRLIAIENVPVAFYKKAMLNLPGAEEQLDHMAKTILNMGKAGIPILGYHWMPNEVWRTSRTTKARGGARVTSFDMSLVENAPLTHGRSIEYSAVLRDLKGRWRLATALIMVWIFVMGAGLRWDLMCLNQYVILARAVSCSIFTSAMSRVRCRNSRNASLMRAI